jgi:hypothetical protein
MKESLFDGHHVGAIVFAFLLSLFGIALFFIGLSEGQEYFFAQNWEKTHGVITRSEIVRDVSRGPAMGTTRVVYFIRIEYSYYVLGSKHIGNRRTFSNAAISDSALAQNVFDSLQENTKVGVFYSPNDPTKSVLDRSVQVESFYIAIIGIAIIFIAISIFCSKYKRHKKALPTMPQTN